MRAIDVEIAEKGEKKKKGKQRKGTLLSHKHTCSAVHSLQLTPPSRDQWAGTAQCPGTNSRSTPVPCSMALTGDPNLFLIKR